MPEPVPTVHDIDALRRRVARWRAAGERIALVPTMGNLHAGHLRLMARARQLAERVVASIFVNPLQFERADDLAAYPRTLEADRARLANERAVDLLFLPAAKTMYPQGPAQCTRVEVPGVSAILEGAFRPGHFAGVATVVAKLLNMVGPDTAVFGAKDYQQLVLVRRMVADLDMSVAIESVPTERAADGLAISSRNALLTPAERAQAGALYAALSEVARALEAGAKDYIALADRALRSLVAQAFEPEYVEIRRAGDLGEPSPEDGELVVLAAAWLGRARLIDNLALRLPQRKI